MVSFFKIQLKQIRPFKLIEIKPESPNPKSKPRCRLRIVLFVHRGVMVPAFIPNQFRSVCDFLGSVLPEMFKRSTSFCVSAVACYSVYLCGPYWSTEYRISASGQCAFTLSSITPIYLWCLCCLSWLAHLSERQLHFKQSYLYPQFFHRWRWIKHSHIWVLKWFCVTRSTWLAGFLHFTFAKRTTTATTQDMTCWAYCEF